MDEFYATTTVWIAEASAAVANYCDHAEHNEAADRRWILDAGQTLRTAALQIAAHEHEDLFELYAERMRQIEQRNPLWSEDAPDGAQLVRCATTWRELQLAQVEHDRHYHPDVIGLTKFDQLRHYALHLAKLTGAVAARAAGTGDVDSFRVRRLPDLMLFGVKLSTVSGERLAQESLRGAGRPLVGRLA